MAASRQLARDSASTLGDRADLALLVAIYANRTSGTVEARDALVDALTATRHLRRFLEAGDEITNVAVDAAGKIAALGRLDGRVELWDVDSGRRMRVIAPPSRGEVARVTFDARGALVAGWTDGSVAVWDSPRNRWQLLLREPGGTSSVCRAPT